MKILRPFAAFAAAGLLTLSATVTLAAEPARILTYGDSNTWGWQPVSGQGFPTGRYDDRTRWSGVLERALQGQAVVTVDGMVGRTTDVDSTDAGEISGESFNGNRSLPAIVARQNPLDLVVIMLGTNDVQAGRKTDPVDVAASAFAMARRVGNMDQALFSTYRAPQVLVIAPPPLGDTSGSGLAGLFSAGEVPSRGFARAFAAEAGKAENAGVLFFDAGSVISTDGSDGIHFSAKTHRVLGEAVAAFVKAGKVLEQQ